MESGDNTPPQNDVHPPVLENRNPYVISSVYHAAISFLQAYGWLMVFASIGLGILYSKLQPWLRSKQSKWQTSQEYTHYDAEETRKRQEAMDKARARLQEQHSSKAEKFAEEQKKKNEQKRQEKIDDWKLHQEGRGYKSKVKSMDESERSSSSQKSKKNVYRTEDYSPMTGGGGGASYRPARRGGAGGGG